MFFKWNALQVLPDGTKLNLLDVVEQLWNWGQMFLQVIATNNELGIDYYALKAQFRIR